MRILFLFLTTLLFANEKFLIAKFQNLEPFYYENQLVNLQLKVLTAKSGKLEILDDKNNSYDIKQLNNNEYISNINFKLKSNFPKFRVSLNDGNITNNLNLSINSEIKKLYPPKDFSNILANNIIINDKVLTNYDDKSNIIYLTINAYGGDAGDFTLHLKDEKLYFLDRNETFTSYSYSAIVPVDKKSFEFSYFNLKIKNYKKITFDMILKNETISTQTDIKPIAKNNLYIINILLVVLLLLWIVLYFYRKKTIYIILIMLNIAILVFFNLPKKDIILQPNTKVHILPFEKSTVFVITSMQTKVKVLEEKNGYKKIEFNKYIGWIKDE